MSSFCSHSIEDSRGHGDHGLVDSIHFAPSTAFDGFQGQTVDAPGDALRLLEDGDPSLGSEKVGRTTGGFEMLLARQLCMRGGEPSRGRRSAKPGGTSPTISKPSPVRVPLSETIW